MWPKAIAQLVELAPHITRLAPLADRFLKDKATGDEATRQVLDGQRSALDAQRAAVTHLGDRLHAEITAITSAQSSQAAHFASLGRQITDLEKHLGITRADALASKQATEHLEGRLAAIEAGQRRIQAFAIVAVALLLVTLALLATLFLHAH